MPGPNTRKPQRIGALWNSKISDLVTLKDRLPGSVLVALDTKFSNISGHQRFSEVGLATLQVHSQPPPFLPGLTKYYEENGVNTLTIRSRDRGLKPPYEDPEYRYGDKVHANEEDVCDIVVEMLSRYEGKKILVGFDMEAEWRWIENMGADVASLCSAWVDLQELVSQRRKQENLGPDNDIHRPGLSNTIHALHIADWRDGGKHCAANDALRNLIVLSGLVVHAPMDRPRPQRLPKPSEFSKLAALKLRPNARITAHDGGKLPLHSPSSLIKLFANYQDLKAVAVNWHTLHQKTNGVRVWAVEFRTEEALEQFVGEVDGSFIDGTRVCVMQSASHCVRPVALQEGQ